MHILGADELWTFTGPGPRGTVDLLLMGESHRPLRYDVRVYEGSRVVKDVWSAAEVVHRLRNAWLLMESETLNVRATQEGRVSYEQQLADSVATHELGGWFRNVFNESIPLTRSMLTSAFINLATADDDLGTGWVTYPSPLMATVLLSSACMSYTWPKTQQEEIRRLDNARKSFGSESAPSKSSMPAPYRCIIHSSVKYKRADTRESIGLSIDMTEMQVRKLLPILFRAAEHGYVDKLKKTTFGPTLTCFDILLDLARSQKTRGGEWQVNWNIYYSAEHIFEYMRNAWKNVPRSRRADVCAFLSNEMSQYVKRKNDMQPQQLKELINCLFMDLYVITQIVRKIELGNGRAVVYAGTNHTLILQKFLSKTYRGLHRACAKMHGATDLCVPDRNPTAAEQVVMHNHPAFSRVTGPAVVKLHEIQVEVLDRLCTGEMCD